MGHKVYKLPKLTFEARRAPRRCFQLVAPLLRRRLTLVDLGHRWEDHAGALVLKQKSQKESVNEKAST